MKMVERNKDLYETVRRFTLSSAICMRKLRSLFSSSVYLEFLTEVCVVGVRPRMFWRCLGVDTERAIKSPMASWKPG